jgi:hypothetical protein
MSEEGKEIIEEGLIVSRRKVIPVGGSKGVTLPKTWLDIQKWLGKEVSELVSVADDMVILVPPEKEQLAKRIIREFEKKMGMKK